MARPIDENDLTNAMDLLRQEMSGIQDKALKLVDKKMGIMITEKSASLMSDVMSSLDAKQMKMMKTIEAKFNAVENSIMDRVKGGDDRLGDRIDDVVAQLNNTRNMLMRTIDELRASLEGLRTTTQEQLLQFKHTVDSSLAEAGTSQQLASEHLKKLDANLNLALADIQETKGVIATRLDGVVMYQRQLEQDLFACENVSCRRVEWEVAEAKRLMLVSRRIALASASSHSMPRQSFFSPPFAAAGVRNLQIELSIKFKDTSKLSATRDVVHIGEANVFLWAPKGSHVWFRLCLNDKVKTFEGKYPSRQPCGGFFGDIDVPVKDDDYRLLLSLEVAESKVVQTHEIAPYVAVNAADGISCSGNLYFSRHVNHRLMDQVKQQVEVVRSRLLKRIEWKVENAAKLPLNFPAGQALLSPYFAIAGVDKLRFQFFPSGYLDPEENPNGVKGFCSLFLHAPAGATINGNLVINMNGNIQKRPIDHYYGTSGSFGRTLFCRYSVIPGQQPEDYIVVSLEINSASQRMESTNNSSEEHGVLKMVRGLEDTKDLSEVRVLPTLWTRYNQHGTRLALHQEGAMDKTHTDISPQAKNANSTLGMKKKKGLSGSLTNMFGTRKK